MSSSSGAAAEGRRAALAASAGASTSCRRRTRPGTRSFLSASRRIGRTSASRCRLRSPPRTSAKFHAIMVNVECSNKAGLTTSATVGPVRFDRTPPVVERLRAHGADAQRSRRAAVVERQRRGDRRRHGGDDRRRHGERRRVGAPHRSRHGGRRRRRRGDHVDHAEWRRADLPSAFGHLALPRRAHCHQRRRAEDECGAAASHRVRRRRAEQRRGACVRRRRRDPQGAAGGLCAALHRRLHGTAVGDLRPPAALARRAQPS